MSKAVIDLQEEILNNKSDVVGILRKAHVIALKLGLSDFDSWIQNELNGYADLSKVPQYREVGGEIKAHNPYRGLIPVLMPSSIAETLNKTKLSQPISQIYDLSKKGNGGSIELPTEVSEVLCSSTGTLFPCYFMISNHSIVGIIDSVKDTILEWCVRLEKDGIVGEGLQFNEKEKEKAKNFPQQVNIYYGQVFNGPVDNLDISNDYFVIYEKLNDLVGDVGKSLQNENVKKKELDDIYSILNEIKEMIAEKKKPSIIKASLLGLKDFLINVGASITADLIIAKINGLF